MNLDSNLLSTPFFFFENGNTNAFMWQNSKKFGLNKYAAKIEISAAHVLCLLEFQELVAVYFWWRLCRLQLATCFTFMRTLLRSFLRFCVTTVRIVLLNCLHRIKFSMQSTFVEFDNTSHELRV